MQDLSAPLAQVARAIAGRLGRRGHRSWIVGGAVRDLALGRETHDVDLASTATPSDVEAEFERTVPLGRNFGTMLIHLGGHDVEHTTFRSESGYTDARRPDTVVFGRSPEEDSTRRDFTCNALYLDPLDDTLLDPSGGIPDLQSGRLACVGDPRSRFAEDGLRIVRMARFAGQLGLEPTPATRTAAAGALDALRGVSPERVRVELERLLERGGVVRALRLLAETGALDRILPGLTIPPGSALERRLALFAQLPEPPGTRLGFAALLDPEASGAQSVASTKPADVDRSLALLEGLRPARALRDHVAEVWRLADEITSTSNPTRAARIRWMRRPAFPDALLLARARTTTTSRDTQSLDDLAREHATLSASGLDVAPFITSADLVARGLHPGPAFGTLLREAETLQLNRTLATREDALRWLDAHLLRDPL